MSLSAKIRSRSAITATLLISLMMSPFVASGETREKAEQSNAGEAIRVATTITSDGVLIASPVVELMPGVVGELTIAGTDGEPFTLFLGSSSVLKTAAGVPYVNLELSTERVGSDGATRLNATSLGVALGQQGSVEVAASQGASFQLTVLATSRPLLPSEAKAAPCAEATAGGADVQSSGCCSARCSRRPGWVLTCCNVISCCDSTCGACCSPSGGGGGPPQEPQ
jgi:hypothetical protein